MSIYRESQSPSVPHRSPFRIRDSHMAKMQQPQQTNVDRWSFSMELGNMWNMKPRLQTDFPVKDNQPSMFSSSGNLLTQLLVSQAILDSNDYQIISFDKIEKLKREYLELHEHIKNISKSIQLENRIKSISKSLSNLNLKNSRNSILYLENQTKHNETKIMKLSTQLEQFKEREITLKKMILEHTAAVLNKGIQHIESTPPATPITTPFQQQKHNDKLVLFKSELNHLSKRIDSLYIKHCDTSFTATTPLDQLKALNYYLSSSTATSKQDNEKDQKNKAKLLDIEHEKNFLVSKLMDMELKMTKLLEQLTHYSSRQKALKFETLQFKGEFIELQLEDKIRQRNQHTQPQDHPKQETHKTTMDIDYQKQLQDQATLYEANIQRQQQELNKNLQTLDHLQINCSKIKSAKTNLDNIIKDKSRALDMQDIQISRLNEEIRNQTRAMSPKNEVYRSETKHEKERLKRLFQEKETRWTEHTHGREDDFDALLEDFDKLTNTAIEFDSKRMKYDRTIDQLNQTVYKLESELIDEKVKKIGYNNHGEAPTTAALRKEFRLLVAEIKSKHQSRMDREADEIRDLQMQLEELQYLNNNKNTARDHSMACQTDFE